MADKIIVKETGPASSGTPGGGLYLIVGALLVAVVVGGFLMFGMPGSGPGGMAAERSTSIATSSSVSYETSVAAMAGGGSVAVQRLTS